MINMKEQLLNIDTAIIYQGFVGVLVEPSLILTVEPVAKIQDHIKSEVLYEVYL